MQDYGPCGKCGKAMPMFSSYVPPVTWMGRAVCSSCSDKLRGLGGSDRPDGGPPAESQQERFGVR